MSNSNLQLKKKHKEVIDELLNSQLKQLSDYNEAEKKRLDDALKVIKNETKKDNTESLESISEIISYELNRTHEYIIKNPTAENLNYLAENYKQLVSAYNVTNCIKENENKKLRIVKEEEE